MTLRGSLQMIDTNIKALKNNSIANTQGEMDNKLIRPSLRELQLLPLHKAGSITQPAMAVTVERLAGIVRGPHIVVIVVIAC